jgi:tetratricopeptide (TPR) repeat protein
VVQSLKKALLFPFACFLLWGHAGEVDARELSWKGSAPGVLHSEFGKQLLAQKRYGELIYLANRTIENSDHAATAYMFLAQAKFQQKDYLSATTACDKVIALRPRSSDGYALRANIYAKIQQFEQALADAEKAIRLNPHCYAAYITKSACLLDQEKLTQTVETCDQAISIIPEAAEAYINRGLAHSRQGMLTEALSDFNAALDLDANNAILLNNRGCVWRDMNCEQKAIEDFKRAAAVSHTFALPYTNMAELYLRQGRYEEAIDCCDASLSRAPAARAYLIRAHSNSKKGNGTSAMLDYEMASHLDKQQAQQYAGNADIADSFARYAFSISNFMRNEALEHINTAIELSPTKPDFYSLRAELRSRGFEHCLAISDLETSIRLGGDPAKNYFRLADAYYHTHNFSKAEENFSKSLEYNTDYLDALFGRALNLQRSNQLSKANAAYNELTRKNPHYTNAYIGSGLTYEGLHEPVLALEQYRRALSVESRNMKGPSAVDEFFVHRTCARLYTETGQVRRALSEYDKLIELAPADPFLYKARGTVYLDRADFERAIKDFDKALSLKDAPSMQLFSLRGMCYLNQGKFQRALIEFDKAAALIEQNKYPRSDMDSDVYLCRGAAHLQSGHPTEFRKDWLKALSLQAQSGEGRLDKMDLKATRYEQSKVDFFVFVNPKDPYAEKFLANEQLRKWNEDEKILISHVLRSIQKKAPGLISHACNGESLHLVLPKSNLSRNAADANPMRICIMPASFASDLKSLEWILVHELVHSADPRWCFSRTSEWNNLVCKNINDYVRRFGYRFSTGSCVDKLAAEHHLPTGYAAYSLEESLAESTTALVLTNWVAPAAVKNYVQHNMLANSGQKIDELRKHSRDTFVAHVTKKQSALRTSVNGRN